MGFLIMMVAIFAIMWFFMIRPQQKKQKEIRNFQNALTEGTSVVTGGGIYGTVKRIDHSTGKIVPGGVAEQTEAALRNVEKVLVAAGAARESVVLCRVYVPDVALWDEVNRVYAAFFGDHKPARVVVPTTALHHGALVEIEAMAELPEEK